MATYTTLKYGSKGDDVKKLQNSLLSVGYDLGSSGADGIYGSKTMTAVKDYQTKNGLSVDGVAGEQTLGKLYSTPSAGTGTTGDGTTVTTPKAPQTSAEWLSHYENGVQNLKPPSSMAGDGQQYESPYAADIEAALDAWKNRKDFTYDFNTDPVYQQYREQYMLGGQQAMRDTMGQAAALTGGYGNSYAQMVGQQTYDNYLSQLNNILPELRQNAYNQYLSDAERDADTLSMLLSLDNDAYGRYNDAREWERQLYLDELDRLYAERDYWYGKNADEQALAAAAASSGRGGGVNKDKDEPVELMKYPDAYKQVRAAFNGSNVASGIAVAQRLLEQGKITPEWYNQLVSGLYRAVNSDEPAASNSSGGGAGKWVAETR